MMLAKLMLPFSLVDEEEFRAVLHELDPCYISPNRKYFSKTAIPAKFNEMKIKMKQDLKSATSISCTTDGWSSSTTDPYISLTVHFIDEAWNLKTYCLRTIYMPESHTGEHIAIMLRSILKEYDLYVGDITSFTTDSGSNMVKACKDLPVTRIPCFGHILHNAINNAFKDEEEVVEAIKHCRQIVSTFSHSFK